MHPRAASCIRGSGGRHQIEALGLELLGLGVLGLGVLGLEGLD